MQAVLLAVTADIQKSKSFYEKLDFEVVRTDPLIMSDGKVFIEVTDRQFYRTGVKLYKKDWKETAELLGSASKVTSIDNGYLVTDPGGTWVYLMEEELQLESKEASFSILGNYAGLSVEYVQFERALDFWQKLGLKITMGGAEQGWVSLESDGFGMSIMHPFACPHQFYNPSLTYFNGGKNLPVIEKIRNAGVPIAEEVTVFNDQGIVDNVILRDPGGLGIFVFND